LFFFERYAGNPSLKVGNASTTISNSSSSSSKKNIGVIIGVVVGSIAALAILIFLMIYFIFYHRRQRLENAHHPIMGSIPMPSIPKGGK
jgi:heme/copper-type cytochrome/quinol oxidase subunit 2